MDISGVALPTPSLHRTLAMLRVRNLLSSSQLVQAGRRCFSDVVVSFKNVNFEFGMKNPILANASFGIQRGSKVTIMGQNGAGSVMDIV